MGLSLVSECLHVHSMDLDLQSERPSWAADLRKPIPSKADPVRITGFMDTPQL